MATKKKEPFIEYKKAPKTPEGLAPLSPSVVVHPSVLGSFLKPLAPLAKAAGTIAKTFGTAITAPPQVEQPKQGGGAPIEPVPPKIAEVSAPAGQPPSELPPYFDMTPEEYIAGDIAKQQEKEEELFGEALSPSTLEQEIQAIAAEGQQKIEFEKKQVAEKKLLEEQEFAEKQKQTAAGIAGTEAAFAPNQEGMISAGAPLVIGEYKTVVQGRIDRYRKELTMGQERRDELIRQMEVAQKQNKIELVQKLRNQITNAEDYLNKQQTAYINALADQTKVQLEIEKLGVSKVSSFINMLGGEGIAMLSPEAVGNMFESNGLPKSYGMALQISQAELQEAKRKGDEFDIAQKQANLVKTLDGLKTEAEKKFEEGQVLDRALQGGMISEDTYNFLLGELKLAPDVTEAKKETEKKEEAEKKALESRRKSAIDKFMALREAIGKKGLSLSVEAGKTFLTEFKTTNDPEEVLNRYIYTAFSVPAVKAAFKKGAGGISIKIPGFFKELEYVANLPEEKIAEFTEAAQTLKGIKGDEGIDFDNL